MSDELARDLEALDLPKLRAFRLKPESGLDL